MTINPELHHRIFNREEAGNGIQPSADKNIETTEREEEGVAYGSDLWTGEPPTQMED